MRLKSSRIAEVGWSFHVDWLPCRNHESNWLAINLSVLVERIARGEVWLRKDTPTATRGRTRADVCSILRALEDISFSCSRFCLAASGVWQEGLIIGIHRLVQIQPRERFDFAADEVSAQRVETDGFSGSSQEVKYTIYESQRMWRAAGYV